MPIVTIQITREGKPEQKAALIKGATDLLADVLNKPPGLTFVVIEEVDMENWGVTDCPRQNTGGQRQHHPGSRRANASSNSPRRRATSSAAGERVIVFGADGRVGVVRLVDVEPDRGRVDEVVRSQIIDDARLAEVIDE